MKDLETDLRTIIGFDYITGHGYMNPRNTERLSGQAISAMEFAKEVRKEYKNAQISTTGHSLGEYLALYVAAENQWKNVGFNGPDPAEILSNKAKKWIKENQRMLTNYRNRGDKLIGNIMGNGTNAEVLVSMNMGLKNPLDYHSIEKWEFDKDGNLILIKNSVYIRKLFLFFIIEKTTLYLDKCYNIGEDSMIS